MKIRNKKTGEIVEIKDPKELAKYGIKFPKAQVGIEIGEDSFNPESKQLLYNAFKDAGYFNDYAVSTRMTNNESGYDFTKPLFDIQAGQFQQPVKEQNNTQFPKSKKFQPNIQGSRSSTETFMTGLRNLPDAIKDPSNPAAWTAVGDLPITGTKAILEQIEAKKTNNRLNKQSVEQFQDAQTLNFLNDYNDSQYGTTNIGMMEDGGIAKYKSMNQGGMANVEVENLETIQTPDGLIDTAYGATHANGGIPMMLEEGSKVFSEKLKHPEKKKSFAKLAKKFETKKDFENLESPIADNINKFTADLNIKFKNKASDELFAEQENMKLNGVFGDKVKNNTMKDYEMKYGGLTKMDIGGLSKEEEDYIKSYKYGTKDAKIAEIAKKLRQNKQLAQYWEKSGVPGGFEGFPGLTDEELLSSLASDKRLSGAFNLSNSNNQITNNTSPKNLGNTNMTPFESTKDSRKKPAWWGDRTKLEEMMSNFEKTSGYSFPYYTPDYDVNKMAADYQKAVINKHPQIVTNLFKNKALPFTNKAVELYKKQNKTKTTPNETELVKFYNKNPQLITEQFGDDLWGMRGFEMQNIPFNSPEEYAAWKQDKDWIPVGDNYFYDVSGENETPMVYTPQLNYPSTTQKTKPLKPSDKLEIPSSTPIEKGKYNNKGFKAIPVVQPFQEPYLESPVARFKFNPNLIDYRNQNPDFTEIDRQYQGAKTGDPRIDANLFAKTLNAKNQIAFGTQAQNRQGQMQVDQYNAGALDRLQQLQYGEDNTYRGLVNQMRGALNTQKLMDRSIAQSNAQKQMDYYNFALPTIETLYGVDPNEQYIKKGNPLSAYTTEKTKEVKKYGGKIKPKFKKKSSK